MKKSVKNSLKMIFVTALIALSFALSKTGVRAADNLYGNYWRMATLAEIDMKSSSVKTDIRFRAAFTGKLSSIMGYWGIADGYGGGDGGIIKCDVQTDDGTSKHLPSGNVIGGFTLVGPANSSVIHPLNTGQQGIDPISFSSQPSVTKGEIYHVVCTNPASNPSTNWWSLNCIGNFVPSSPVQTVGDIENAAVYFDGSTWHNPYSEYTPIFTLAYTDGNKQGMPYMQRDNTYKVYGSNQLYQSFKVSGSNKTATSVVVAMVKTGNPGVLTVRLETNSGTLIEQGSIPASAFVTNQQDPRWGTYTFSSAQNLAAGSSYRVVFSATGDSSNYYSTWVLQNGTSYNLEGERFKDSQSAFYTTNASSWNYVQNHDDMMMYFTLSDSTAPTPSDTIPPTRSSASPSGVLPAGTSQATPSLATDENATCKYATAAGISYENMYNTFATTGGKAHSSNVSGLQNASIYSYYVKCKDATGNINTDDYIISFSVASPAALLGDLNADNSVNLTDFNIIKSDFLKLFAALSNPKSDIDGDGQATIKDVGIMMSGWK